MRAMLPRGPQGGVSEGCMSDLSRQTLHVLSCAGLLNDLFGVGASVRVQFSEQPKLALAESGQKWCTHPTHPRNHVQKTKGRTREPCASNSRSETRSVFVGERCLLASRKPELYPAVKLIGSCSAHGFTSCGRAMLELEKPGCGSVAMRIGGAVVSKSWLRKLPSKWKVKLGTGYKISPGCQGVDATGLCAASLSSPDKFCNAGFVLAKWEGKMEELRRPCVD